MGEREKGKKNGSLCVSLSLCQKWQSESGAWLVIHLSVLQGERGKAKGEKRRGTPKRKYRKQPLTWLKPVVKCTSRISVVSLPLSKNVGCLFSFSCFLLRCFCFSLF